MKDKLITAVSYIETTTSIEAIMTYDFESQERIRKSTISKVTIFEYWKDPFDQFPIFTILTSNN
jgi:hypothetical protein